MVSKFFCFLLCFAAVAGVESALAQDGGGPPGGEGGDWQVETGAGVMFSPDYEGSDDYDVTPVPIVEIGWKDRVTLTTKGGPSLLATPFLDDDFRVDVGIRYDFGRDEDDNDALQGLGDLEVGAIGVLRAEYALGPLDAGLELAHDLSGDRDGTAATLELGTTRPVLGGKALPAYP